MRLVILGASGLTGQCLMTQALAAGHDVTVVVRNPDKIKRTHDKLKVVEEVDMCSESSLQQHMTGHDVVLSCLGAPRIGVHFRRSAEVILYSESIKFITTAMRRANISRFIGITSRCTTDEKGPFLMDWIMKQLFLKKTLSNMGVMEAYLKNECADINYTVVKPPRLLNGNITDEDIKTEEGQYVHGGTHAIFRADVAKFMMSCLGTDKWDRKLVSIAY